MLRFARLLTALVAVGFSGHPLRKRLDLATLPTAFNRATVLLCRPASRQEQ